MASTNTPFYLFAAHGGAGFHPHGIEEREVKYALRAALTAATASADTSPLSAIATAVRIISSLEDAEPLNAGYGSNLTQSGSVECDASLMDASGGEFGSVGAVGGIKNPVRLAQAVLERRRIRDKWGRVPPLLLVGEGARDFAFQQGVELVPAQSLITHRALEEWRHWNDKVGAVVDSLPDATSDILSADRPSESDGLHVRQDTVGAVVMHDTQELAAGVSRYASEYLAVPFGAELLF
jgi:taspase, threonine aspartase, 1